MVIRWMSFFINTPLLHNSSSAVVASGYYGEVGYSSINTLKKKLKTFNIAFSFVIGPN